jgi:hypothetical protein
MLTIIEDGWCIYRVHCSLYSSKFSQSLMKIIGIYVWKIHGWVKV